MPDRIKLLPDHIANQIAAGEVIQRPASVVKELVENAIDAGASSIRLIVKEAGKTLIQIIDNGVGMTGTDARMSIERHATSKISTSDDLFAIQTKGFRGEALASIAAVAQMEIKTRVESDELGSRLVVEESKVVEQEPVVCPVGTDMAVKNLFFNIPARKKFLKGDATEFRYILAEFNRLALASPGVRLELYHNDQLIKQLPPQKDLKRANSVLGKKYRDKLVSFEEETEVVTIKGFIGTVESARGRRDNQYFFINDRHFKSPYFGHAVASAYGNLLEEGKYPVFIIFLQADPARIDVNVHPTKQEVKFEDERTIYNYLKVAVRHALAKHHMIPVMDFEKPDPAILRKGNPFQHSGSAGGQPPVRHSDQGGQNWEAIYDGLQQRAPQDTRQEGPVFGSNSSSEADHQSILWVNGFLICSTSSGHIQIVHQRHAHIRILYEHFMARYDRESIPSQRLLFPATLDLSAEEVSTLESVIDDLNQMGFDIAPFGQNTFVLHGVPAIQDNVKLNEESIKDILQQMAEETWTKEQASEKLAMAAARSAALSMDKKLALVERVHLIRELMDCDLPDRTPAGKKCYVLWTMDEVINKFK